MPDSDPPAPPPESAFHGHDVPDRLETEEQTGPEEGGAGEGGAGEEPDARPRSDEGPTGPGVKSSGTDRR